MQKAGAALEMFVWVVDFWNKLERASEYIAISMVCFSLAYVIWQILIR